MSDSAETPSSSNNNSSTLSASSSPPSPQSPSVSNSTAPPPSSDNSNSSSSSSQPQQAPPPTPPPQSPPPSPPPQTPPPSSSPQTPDPSSNPSAPPTGQKHAPSPSSTPNGNGNENGGGNTPPSPTVSSPPPPAETSKPPSGSQSPPNAQVAPSPLTKGGDSSSQDSGLAAPTGSPRRGFPPTRQPPSISTSPPTESTSHTTGNDNENIKIGTGVAVAGFVIIVIVTVIFLVIKGRKKKPTNVYAANGYLYGKQAGMQGYHSSGGNGSQRGNMYHGPFIEPNGIGKSQVAFTYEEMVEMTNRFSEENVIGGGGFGSVFKGFLPDGRPVAVKQLKAGSGQGEREFRAEVEIISRVHHRHLVSLVGYCISQEQRLLIYEFVPNNTLEHHLHGNGMPVLEWSKRLKIAIGAAKGLSYLHDDCHPKIIHRDIKSANILLDEAFESKVADFGLARLTNDAHSHVSTRVMGTFGYMAPEYASSGKLTDKSDVFSFGVVLLELATGRKSVDPSQPLGEESLVEWARPYLINAIETRNLSKLVDPRLENNYVEDEMFRMIESAAACIRRSAPKRPRIVQVMRALDSEAASNDLSNGFKYGQSTIYDSGQYNQDILRFRQMVHGSFDFDMYSGEHITRDSSQRHQ